MDAPVTVRLMHIKSAHLLGASWASEHRSKSVSLKAALGNINIVTSRYLYLDFHYLIHDQ